MSLFVKVGNWHVHVHVHTQTTTHNCTYFSSGAANPEPCFLPRPGLTSSYRCVCGCTCLYDKWVSVGWERREWNSEAPHQLNLLTFFASLWKVVNYRCSPSLSCLLFHSPAVRLSCLPFFGPSESGHIWRARGSKSACRRREGRKLSEGGRRQGVEACQQGPFTLWWCFIDWKCWDVVKLVRHYNENSR